MPYIMDLTFFKYEFEKSKKIIKGDTISKNQKILNYYT